MSEANEPAVSYSGFDDLSTVIVATTFAELGYFRLSEDNCSANFSDTVFDLYGFDRLSHPSLYDMLARHHSDDRDILQKAMTAAKGHGDQVSAEHRIYHPTKGPRHLWTRMQYEPGTAATGGGSLFATTLDITNLRSDEAVMIENERHLSFLLNYSQDVFVRCRTSDGMCTYASPAIATLLGYDPKEVIGRHPHRMVHPDDFLNLVTRLREAGQSRGKSPPGPIQYRMLHKFKGWLWVESNIQVIFGPDMKPIEWIDCVRDIHARKLAEEAAAEAMASAEAAVKSKIEFLSILTDELRTPLTGILGLGELIGTEGGLSGSDRHYLDLVQAASRQILDVVNNVLDVSRLETGTDKLVQETFRLSDTVASVMVAQGPQAQAKGVNLTVQMPQILPLTIGDPGRIGQIMLNMVDSAIKHAAGGEIRLKVDMRVTITTARLRISIQETGTGVAPDLLARLQEQFSQTQPPIQAAPGAGLGLSISRQLVALMGGVLGEGPLPHGGSQVWFELGLPLDPAEPVIDLEPAPIAAGTQPLRVLLAEDNAFSQELIKTILSPLGYQIDTVENGQSAIFAAQRNSYDLILMDIRMPGMDGHAAAKAIRALGDRWAKVPIIALSAADKPSDIRECFAVGINDHVGKPILTSALYAAIARHVKA